MHIYHAKPSLDTVFYANEPKQFRDSQKTFYYNSDSRAMPLACVDTTQLCSADGKRCWFMNSAFPDDFSSTPSYWSMKWSLGDSDTYGSIKWRLGTALKAQESISQTISPPLSPVQWQIEAKRLLATSLARIQYDAYDIATGADRDRPGYVEVTPEETRGHLCGHFKFETSDSRTLTWLRLLGSYYCHSPCSSERGILAPLS